MTVYVDDMYKWSFCQFGRMKMSHMIADTLDELHAMADAVGVARKHFQDKPSGQHYDLAKSKRLLAIEKGAIPIELRTLSCMCFVRRVKGRLPKHYLAEIEWRRLQRQLSLATARRKAELAMRARQDKKMRAVRTRILREPRIRIRSQPPV